jgi:hypothetical protein
MVTGVELIAAALAAGTAAGITNTANAAVLDAYRGLKELPARRLSGRDQARQCLDARAAARQLLALHGAQSGKYQADLRGAKGVQVGDHGVQHNTFS